MAATTAGNTPLSILTQPLGGLVCLGKAFTFLINAADTVGITLSYQWYKNGSAIGAATSSTYTIASAAYTDAGTYYCVITDNVTPTANTLQSFSAVLNVVGTA